MLSRDKILVAAAPTTRKQVSVMMVMNLVKQYSVPAVGPAAIVTQTWWYLRLIRALAAAATLLDRSEISLKVSENQAIAQSS
jgi:hypothetical protein